MKSTTYLKVRIDIADAEDFIASKLESETGCKAIVSIESRLKQFELLPCLAAARNAYVICPKERSAVVAAIKVFREEAQKRGFDLSLSDCKAVVEGFVGR